MKITAFLFCSFLITNLLGQDKCYSITQKGDFCFESADLPGYSAKFNEKLKMFWFRTPKSKKTTALELSDTLPNTAYYLNLLALKTIKKPQTVLFLQAALGAWDKIKLTLNYNYTDSGLGIKILKSSKGEEVESGQTVTVHYTGMFEDGRIFDSSVERDVPFSFKVGEGRVIKGWDEGLAKLRVGNIAFLQIPPDLGYGPEGRGIIPGNATLYFKIEVLSVE